MSSARIASRFLTGGLAAAAVTASFAFASPAKAADVDDRPCGSPAVDAVYTTLVIDPVFRTVPALTHTEWRWQRDVTGFEYEYGRVVTAGYDEVDWTREVPGPLEYLFRRTVVDQPGMPAIPGIPEIGHFVTVIVTPAVVVSEDEYQHQVTGKLRWESPDWGAQSGGGDGWVKTGNQREREITPAVTQQQWMVDVPAKPSIPATPEVSHVESQWATSAPGGAWAGPFDSRPGTPITEHQTTSGSAPAGDGWVQAASKHVDAVLDLVWATESPGGDWTPTGDSRPAGTDHEETIEPAAIAPDGDGWTIVDGSAVTVVDSPEQQELVTPGSTQEVLVSPAQPATAPCPAGPAEEAADEGDGDVAPPQAAPAATTDTLAPAAEVATALPNTGGVPGWLAPAGLASIAAGVMLVRTGRRKASLI